MGECPGGTLGEWGAWTVGAGSEGLGWVQGVGEWGREGVRPCQEVTRGTRGRTGLGQWEEAFFVPLP